MSTFHDEKLTKTSEFRVCKYKNLVSTYPESCYWSIQYVDEITKFQKRPASLVVKVSRDSKELHIRPDLILPGAFLKIRIKQVGTTRPQVVQAEEITLNDPTDMGLLRHVLNHFENITFESVMSFLNNYKKDAINKYVFLSSTPPSLLPARRRMSQFFKNQIFVPKLSTDDSQSTTIWEHSLDYQEQQFIIHLCSLHYFLPNFSILQSTKIWDYDTFCKFTNQLCTKHTTFFEEMIPNFQLFEDKVNDDKVKISTFTYQQLSKLAWKDRHALAFTIDKRSHDVGDLCDQKECVFMQTFLLLHDAEREGIKHSCMPLKSLVTQLQHNLSICHCWSTETNIENTTLIALLRTMKKFCIFSAKNEKDQDWIALSETYFNEKFSLELFRNPKVIEGDEKYDDVIDLLDEKKIPTEEQLRAIGLLKQYAKVCLQGSAGSGKTTMVLRQIVMAALRKKMNITLLAPTGAAADRMTESIANEGICAHTIHRVLMQRAGLRKRNENGMKICKRKTLHENEVSVLDSKTKVNVQESEWRISGLLIVDEATMVSTDLFRALWDYVDVENCHIILVGDHCQLPAIAHGNLFADLVHHKEVQTATLTKVLRQKDDSAILAYAAWFRYSIVNEKVLPRPLCPQNEEMRAFYLADKKELSHYVLNQIKKNLPNQIQYHLISPLKTDNVWGCNHLNHFLQQSLNKSGVDKMERQLSEMKLKPFRCKMAIGDPVVFRVNRPDFNLSNGSIGTVRDCKIKRISADSERDKDIWEASEFDQMFSNPNLKINENMNTSHNDRAIEFILYEGRDRVSFVYKWVPKNLIQHVAKAGLCRIQNVKSVWKIVEREEQICIKDATVFDALVKDAEVETPYSDKMVILLVEFPQKSGSIWRWIEVVDDRLELAYVCTVHVSQGATYDHLIVLVPPPNDQRSHFYTAQLMYTAFTRASKSLVVFYDTQKVLQQYAKNKFKRNTILSV